MEDQTLFTKLKQLRNKYSLDMHKQLVMDWEKKVRTALVRQDVMKHAAIKDLIKNLKKIIKEITFSLAWDDELNKPEFVQQRRDMFVARKCWKWVVSFFEDSKKQIENIEKMVEEEIKG